MLAHQLAGAFVEHVDADLGQHPQRCQVDRFQLVVGDQPGRLERDRQLAEGGLLEGGARAGALAGPAAAAAAVRRKQRIGGLDGGGHCASSMLRGRLRRIMDAPRFRECGDDDH